MKRWQWEASRLARELGLPGGMALLLAVVCAATWLGGVLPLKQEAEQLRLSQSRLERRAVEEASVAASAPVGLQQQLLDFKTRFGDERSLSGALARLQAAARRHGVQLDQAEFKLNNEARDPLARYAMVLPVKAEYRALRRFTHDAMGVLPGLALEEVTLRRGDARSPVLDAQLRFVLFVTKAGS